MKYLSDIGIGKVPEQGALDVEGDIYSNGEKVSTSTPTMKVAIGTLNVTSTGEVVVDGFGFRPQVVRFTCSRTSEGVNAPLATGTFTSDGSYYAAMAARTNGGGSRAGSGSIRSIAISGSGSVVWGTIIYPTSLDSDGFTVNINTANALDYWFYEAIGFEE